MAPCTRAKVKLEHASFHNSRSLLTSLPIELLHRIASCEKQAIIPWIHESDWHSERRDLLHNLCQLCRSLRAVFLPLLWERLEACPVHYKLRYKYGPSLANDLLGQLKLVMNDRLPYAPYVRVVSVAVSRSNPTDAILKKLARALSLMQNVHTVQIICLDSTTPYMVPSELSDVGQLQKAFNGYICPSVSRIVVPHQAKFIFACFPQAQHVHISDGVDDFSDSVAEVAKYCHAIESFGWVESIVWDCSTNWSTVVTMLPRLRRLEYYITLGQLGDVMELSKLQNLEQITLDFEGFFMGCDEATQIFKTSRSVLTKSKSSQYNK